MPQSGTYKIIPPSGGIILCNTIQCGGRHGIRSWDALDAALEQYRFVAAAGR
jgi:hypothetical protein